MGSDWQVFKDAIEELEFQSTLPHGERLSFGRNLAGLSHFNPRSRMGSDVLERGQRGGVVISIHAPAWGATTIEGGSNTWNLISIHAPAWGATKAVWNTVPICEFQSTLPHGERLPVAGPLHTHFPISIHAPAWGATVPL